MKRQSIRNHYRNTTQAYSITNHKRNGSNASRNVLHLIFGDEIDRWTHAINYGTVV